MSVNTLDTLSEVAAIDSISSSILTDTNSKLKKKRTHKYASTAHKHTVTLPPLHIPTTTPVVLSACALPSRVRSISPPASAAVCAPKSVVHVAAAAVAATMV